MSGKPNEKAMGPAWAREQIEEFGEVRPRYERLAEVLHQRLGHLQRGEGTVVV